jgi:hypothetical protein
LSSAFFKPSRNSVRHQEESHASAVNRIIKPVTPAGGGIGAVTTDGIIYGVTNCLSVFFDDRLASEFLQTTISLDGRSVFTTASEK